MKESIAQSFIISLILFFFGILVLLLFGSINYSKAYKAKNRIITIIEKYGSLTDDAKKEISDNLQKGGYQTVLERTNIGTKCQKFVKNLGCAKLVYPVAGDGTGGRHHQYCVIEVNSSSIGNYYQVITFMKFNVPIIGDVLEFPVKGETKVLYDLIDENNASNINCK